MPMFFQGYSRTLSMDDLFAIDDDLEGTTLYERLLKSWLCGKLRIDLPVSESC